jgi:hypothetical protein
MGVISGLSGFLLVVLSVEWIIWQIVGNRVQQLNPGNEEQ